MPFRGLCIACPIVNLLLREKLLALSCINRPRWLNRLKASTSEILKDELNSLSVSIKPARSKLSGSSWTHAVPDLGITSSFKIQVVPFANGVNPGDTVGQSTTWYTKILIPKVYHY